jgi:hypothetical protein
MKATHTVSLVSLGALAIAALSCAEGTTGGPFEGEGGGPTFEPSLVPITFEVTARQANATRGPLAGARCAVQPEGGEAIERTTGPDGTAIFELEAWPETLSVTCVKHHGTSWVGLRRSELAHDSIELYVQDEAPPVRGPMLTGAIDSPGAAGEYRLVQATNQLAGPYEGQKDSYVLNVEDFVPFGIFAVRFEAPRKLEPRRYAVNVLGWAAWSHRPITDNAVFDVDFAEPVLPSLARGSVSLPALDAGLHSPLDDASMWGRAFVYPKAAPGEVLLGFATETELTVDVPRLRRAMHYTTESYEGFYAPEDVYTELVLEGRDPAQPYSMIVMDGYPPSGALHERFLDVPIAIEPKQVVPLRGAVLRWAPEQEQPNAFVVEDAEGTSLTVIWADARAELIVPDLPVRWARALASPVTGRLLRVEQGERDPTNTRYAASRELRFRR